MYSVDYKNNCLLPRHKSSNGQTRCRDYSNGQFTKDANCNNNVNFNYAAILSTDYSLTERFALGVGVRASDNIDVFGTLRANLNNVFSVQLNGGAEYYAANVLVNF